MASVWSTVKGVTPAEWSSLQAELRASYGRVSATLRDLRDWDDGDTLSVAMGMVAHTACYLGAIRQGLRALS